MRYRLQRHDGTDCSATMVPITVLRMVPIQRYRHNCPITVFTDGYLLTLKNASPDRDMTIRITDMAKGGVVYENDIPEVQSAYITISIANFPAEEYKLEITGTPSGHLTGYFTKE